MHSYSSSSATIIKTSVLQNMRLRLLILSSSFIVLFMIVILSLLDVTLFFTEVDHHEFQKPQVSNTRGRILDKDGNILGTTLVTASLYCTPKYILDPKEAALKLGLIFPDLSYNKLMEKFTSEKGFEWVKRNLSPAQQQAVLSLGIPGLDFEYEKKRLYPQGSLFAHVLGLVDIDGIGIAGIEKQFAKELEGGNDIHLSLSLAIQHALYDELKKGIDHFQADGGSAVMVDIETGEVKGMVSLPDFDPNIPNSMTKDNAFNRNTLGVYELGSIMKIFNTALYLKYGKGGKDAVFDITHPIRVGRFTINDYRGGQKRPLTVEEIFYYSSNIGAAHMALSVGIDVQYSFFKEMGFFDKPQIELPERGKPMYPKKTSQASAMTMAFGHGMAMTPIQFLSGLSNLLNGKKHQLTLLKKEKQEFGENVFSPKDSQTLCNLMRMVVEKGTAGKAKVKGYLIGAKTGTAEKIEHGRYQKNGKNLNSFVGAFPIDNPKYLVFVTLDYPKARPDTYGFTAAGWNAAPVGGKIIRRLASLLNLPPVYEDSI